jgi:hypothetical protein
MQQMENYSIKLQGSNTEIRLLLCFKVSTPHKKGTWSGDEK